MTKKNIIILILIFAFVVVLFLLDLPAYDNVNLLRGEVKQYKEFLKAKEELAVKVNQLKQVYESRKDELDRVSYVLPTGRDIPNLIVQLEALASENGLILEQLNFIEPKKSTLITEAEDGNPATELETAKGYKTLGISLSVSGSYQAFGSFLQALELNIHLMDIKSIDFSVVQTEAPESAVFTFVISLETYYQ